MPLSFPTRQNPQATNDASKRENRSNKNRNEDSTEIKRFVPGVQPYSRAHISPPPSAKLDDMSCCWLLPRSSENRKANKLKNGVPLTSASNVPTNKNTISDVPLFHTRSTPPSESTIHQRNMDFSSANEGNNMNSEMVASRSILLKNKFEPLSNEGTGQRNKGAGNSISSSSTSTPPPSNKVLIASSSITKGIDYRRFNECFEQGKTWIQKWPGGKARHIKNYIKSHLDEEKPDVILILAGGNDLAEENQTPVNIAHDVIEIAIKAKQSGVRDVLIGSVPVRSRQFSMKRWHELNNALFSLCQDNNFVYIDNGKIKVDHLHDGVHLTNEGTVILADNYLEALRLVCPQ